MHFIIYVILSSRNSLFKSNHVCVYVYLNMYEHINNAFTCKALSGKE